MWPLTSIGHISNTLIVFVLSPRSIIVHMHVLTLTRLFLSNMNISSLEMKPSPFVSNTSKQNFFFSSKSPRRNTDKPLTHSSRLTYPSLSWSNALKTEIKVYAWWPQVFYNHSFLVINSISGLGKVLWQTREHFGRLFQFVFLFLVWGRVGFWHSIKK